MSDLHFLHSYFFQNSILCCLMKNFILLVRSHSYTYFIILLLLPLSTFKNAAEYYSSNTNVMNDMNNSTTKYFIIYSACDIYFQPFCFYWKEIPLNLNIYNSVLWVLSYLNFFGIKKWLSTDPDPEQVDRITADKNFLDQIDNSD